MAKQPTAGYRQLIDGELVGAASGAVWPSLEPATGVHWADIPRGDGDDVDAAVAAARRALPGWKGLPALQRARHLRAAGDRFAAHIEELATVESRDGGRPIIDTSRGDVPACVEMWHYFAGAADKLAGETIGVGPTSFNFTTRQPVGVVGVIIPWNAPLSLFTAKVAAVLAAGNTAVVKPAEQASCSVLRAAELLADVLPAGVLNVVSGLGEEAGDALVRHPDVRRITFTGSTETGRTISAAAAGTLKQLAFELGGKSPNLVFADADLDAAAVGVTTMSLFTGNAGQTCIAGSRILVQASIYEEMVERIRRIAAEVVLGDPLDPAATMGPLVSAEQLERVASYLAIGQKEGAELAFGGRYGEDLFPTSSALRGGYFVEPTLFLQARNDMRISREEIFGPVGVVIPFDDDDEALAIANDSSYGLASGVWTTNLARAHRFVRDLDTGSVWVNTYRKTHWAVPFGGLKDSGYGRDSGMESVLENTALKGAWIDLA